jgi:hypothetical protein
MQNFSQALGSNVNSGPLVFSAGTYNNLPSSTIPKRLCQTFPFIDEYQAILKNETLDATNVLDHGPMKLHAIDFQRNVDLPYTVKTGTQLTTVKYVQDTVARWAEYAAFCDIDVSGNKIKDVSEVKFVLDSAITESRNAENPSVVDLKLTTPGDLTVSALEVIMKTGKLSVANLVDPSQNSFTIEHEKRKQAIVFNSDGSIDFKVGKVLANGSFENGPNTVTFDCFGRIQASIISPPIQVLPVFEAGAISWTLNASQEMPSAFTLPDITITDISKAFLKQENGLYYIVDVNLPANLPSSFIYNTLIINKSTQNILVDANGVLNDLNYLINFNDTLTISQNSACAVTLMKSSPTSVLAISFNLMVTKTQAQLEPLV